MEKLHFDIGINATPRKVYDVMLSEESYKAWTKEFNPSSSFEGSWEKGAKIVFLGTDENGNTGGMVSRIRENIPGKFVSIEHQGIMQGDQEITSGHDIEAWAGAREEYTFTEDNEGTLLAVDIDVTEDHRSYFQNTWPKALNKLKTLCEAK